MQPLTKTAKAQIQNGNGVRIEKDCPKCKGKTMIHDYECSEDWCPNCGYSERWEDDEN